MQRRSAWGKWHGSVSQGAGMCLMFLKMQERQVKIKSREASSPLFWKTTDPLSAWNRGITWGSRSSSEHKANEEPGRKISCKRKGCWNRIQSPECKWAIASYIVSSWEQSKMSKLWQNMNCQHQALGYTASHENHKPLKRGACSSAVLLCWAPGIALHVFTNPQ